MNPKLFHDRGQNSWLTMMPFSFSWYNIANIIVFANQLFSIYSDNQLNNLQYFIHCHAISYSKNKKGIDCVHGARESVFIELLLCAKLSIRHILSHWVLTIVYELYISIPVLYFKKLSIRNNYGTHGHIASN